MSKNVNSEVGYAEDLIRSIVQMGCAEHHAIGLYFKATAELENGIIDTSDSKAVQNQIKRLGMFKEDIGMYADLRRQMMKTLFDAFDGDKDLWCMIKHLGMSAYQCMEAYQNSDDDVELLRLAYESNKAFTKAMTRFLGIEIGDCAACMSEALKADKLKGVDENDEE